jgi:hypothetical protein
MADRAKSCPAHLYPANHSQKYKYNWKRIIFSTNGARTGHACTKILDTKFIHFTKIKIKTYHTSKCKIQNYKTARK